MPDWTVRDDANAGGGEILLHSIAATVIAGTSPLGGRGQITSALLGALAADVDLKGVPYTAPAALPHLCGHGVRCPHICPGGVATELAIGSGRTEASWG